MPAVAARLKGRAVINLIPTISRDFVPWRISVAGRISAWIITVMPATENQHTSRHRAFRVTPSRYFVGQADAYDQRAAILEGGQTQQVGTEPPKLVPSNDR